MTKTVKLSKITKKNQTTDSKNKENVKAKVAKQRDYLYLYDDDMDSDAKKKFRTGARRKRDSFFKAIKVAENENAQKKSIREGNTWAKGIYTKGNLPKFGS